MKYQVGPLLALSQVHQPSNCGEQTCLVSWGARFNTLADISFDKGSNLTSDFWIALSECLRLACSVGQPWTQIPAQALKSSRILDLFWPLDLLWTGMIQDLLKIIHFGGGELLGGPMWWFTKTVKGKRLTHDLFLYAAWVKHSGFKFHGAENPLSLCLHSCFLPSWKKKNYPSTMWAIKFAVAKAPTTVDGWQVQLSLRKDLHSRSRAFFANS